MGASQTDGEEVGDDDGGVLSTTIFNWISEEVLRKQ